VHISLHHFAAVIVFSGTTMGLMAQVPNQLAGVRLDAAIEAGPATESTQLAPSSSPEAVVDNPVADPRAIVGLVSRSGWALVDDSTRPLFDSADFSFQRRRKEPVAVGDGAAGGRAAGLVLLRLRARLPQGARRLCARRRPHSAAAAFAFGAWWSRYWAYSDQELDELVRGFHENDTPLDVFVIDMDWHISASSLKAMGEVDQSGHGLGWSGYTWNKLLFPDPDAVPRQAARRGPEDQLNLHPASGVQPWEQAYPAMAKAMGIDPATRKYVPFDITDKKVRHQLHEPAAPSAGEAGHRLLVARLAAGAENTKCPA
jgi:hypothetical protein